MSNNAKHVYLSQISRKSRTKILQGEESDLSSGQRAPGLVLEHQETLLMINTIPEMVPFYPNAFTKLGVK